MSRRVSYSLLFITFFLLVFTLDSFKCIFSMFSSCVEKPVEIFLKRMTMMINLGKPGILMILDFPGHGLSIRKSSFVLL